MLDCLFQLVSIDHVSTIFVNSCEIRPQLFNLRLVCHFDKHIHGCFLEFTHTSERLESFQSWSVECRRLEIRIILVFHIICFFHHFHPWVTQRSSGSKSFAWVCHKQLWYQVFHFSCNYLELFMFKVIICILNFLENFPSILTLERQIPTHEYVQ